MPLSQKAAGERDAKITDVIRNRHDRKVIARFETGLVAKRTVDFPWMARRQEALQPFAVGPVLADHLDGDDGAGLGRPLFGNLADRYDDLSSEAGDRSHSMGLH